MASSRRRECKIKPDSFCNVSGCYTLFRQRRNITSFVKLAYKAYFQIFLGNREWSFHIVCQNREEMLCGWTKEKERNCLLELPWFGENPEITLLTVIFELSTRKVLARRIGIRSRIQAFSQPFDLFHIAKNLWFRF